jgi:cell division protein FtsB
VADKKFVVGLQCMIRLKILDKIPPVFKNKYILTVIIFIVWVVLFDSNNLIARFREVRELNNLKKDKEYYINKIESDRRKLYELKTNNHNLEKFAREQYRMKKPDEDLYIVLTPQEDRKITRKNN